MRPICIHALLISVTLTAGSASGTCSSDNREYQPGDKWYTDDKCILNVCSNQSTVESYRKKCPSVPYCEATRAYIEDCCERCRKDDSPPKGTGRKENGYRTHACRRECTPNTPMTCMYDVTVEYFEAMSTACFDCPFNVTDCNRAGCVPADGVSRLIHTVSRMLPGPQIDVCLGDTIVVDVHNLLLDEDMVIHWHGLPQYGTPYMDGVSFVTQCPIQKTNSFRYSFAAQNPGTYFYHSLVEQQTGDGLSGALVIRQPDNENPLQSTYDWDLFEHRIILQDWSHQTTEEAITRDTYVRSYRVIENILVNGMGRLLEPPSVDLVVSEDSSTNRARQKLRNMPFAEFEVEKRYRYRFRVVNAGSLGFPLAVSIDNHTLWMISADGSDIEPIDVEQFVINGGERYDFVLNANQDVADYWIRVKVLNFTGETKVQQLAILRYKGSVVSEPEQSMHYDYPRFIDYRLGNIPEAEENRNTFKVSDLRAIKPLDPSIGKQPPDSQLFFQLSAHNVENPKVMASPDTPNPSYQINNITFDYPPSLLLTQPLEDLPLICNVTTLLEQNIDCGSQLCECVFMVNVKLNDTVEIIMFTNDDTADYAMHIHGYTARILAMERMAGLSVQQLMDMDAKGLLERNFDRPVLKDTVIVYNPGYTILRFHATNPGIWMLQPHSQIHFMRRMAVLIKVGELSDLPPIPPHFPECGNFLPM